MHRRLMMADLLVAEDAAHAKQVALIRFLSDAARKMRVGEHIYVVGGAVRDFVLGMPIKDVDIVVDSVALGGKDSAWFAEQLQRIIPARTTLATNQYGVAILSVSDSWLLDGHDMQGEVIEIANAREESYGGGGGKGYKPSEVAAASIKADVYRREFTFNTLMWRLSDLASGPDKAEIVDITGCGLRDLRAGEMRCPSDPDKTFADDPTRMLRAIKFLVRYDWKIPPEVAESIRKNAYRLRDVPYEAVVALLTGSVIKEASYQRALRAMGDLGLLDVVASILRDKPGAAAYWKRWVSDKRVQFLFDLMDVGLPSGARMDFLSRQQQERLREVSLVLPPGHPERLLDALRQPGKVVDMGAMIKDLGLSGAKAKALMDAAREALLEDPSLLVDRERLASVMKNRVRPGTMESVFGAMMFPHGHFERLMLSESGPVDYLGSSRSPWVAETVALFPQARGKDVVIERYRLVYADKHGMHWIDPRDKHAIGGRPVVDRKEFETQEKYQTGVMKGKIKKRFLHTRVLVDFGPPKVDPKIASDPRDAVVVTDDDSDAMRRRDLLRAFQDDRHGTLLSADEAFKGLFAKVGLEERPPIKLKGGKNFDLYAMLDKGEMVLCYVYNGDPRDLQWHTFEKGLRGFDFGLHTANYGHMDWWENTSDGRWIKDYYESMRKIDKKRADDLWKKFGPKDPDRKSGTMESVFESTGASAPCAQCGGPAHEATGWVLQTSPQLAMLCGRCARDFAKWYKGRMTQFSLLSSSQRKLLKSLGLSDGDGESFSQAAMRSVRGD